MISADLENDTARRVACFVSPHGFGHAARLAATADAIHRAKPECRFELFTSVPEWFFRQSMNAPFTYRSEDTDLGLVQLTPFKVDVSRTIQKLNEFLPFDPSQLSYLSYMVRQSKCELILCDISPLGLAVGRQAGLPTLLIENFTWDWLYEGYASESAELEKHIQYLKRIFRSADYHVQAEPVCLPQPADLTVRPIWRKFRRPPPSIRKKLGIPDHHKMVLVTTGGIAGGVDPLNALPSLPQIRFVLPGNTLEPETRGNLLLLPHKSSLFHPDLVNASDAVIGKIGYSTLAEVYGAGVPFGHVSPGDSRESRKLADFVDKEMIGLAIEETEFYNGSWTQKLQELLAAPRLEPRGINGADQVAEFVCRLLENPKQVST